VATLLSNLFKPRINAIGLEIGGANIKAVDLGPNHQLLNYARRPTPAGLLQDGLVGDPEALGEELRALHKELRTRKKQVVTALANDVTVVRVIRVPKMSEKELEEAIPWEAERYIPFPIDEVVLDYALLDDPEKIEDQGEMEVLIAAAREETVMQLVEVLNSAGLEPVVIDLKPFAGLRPLEGLLKPEEEGGEPPVTLYLEVGHTATSLVLLKGERPLLSRSIGIAGKEFTQAIARNFNMSLEDAEEIKREYALATLSTEDEEALLDLGEVEQGRPTPSDIYAAIRPVLIDLSTEVRRSLEFFSAQGETQTPDQAFIAGGGSKLKGLRGVLSDVLGIHFNDVNPWAALKVDTGRFEPGILEDDAAEFTVPVGLALRGVSRVG